MERITKQENGVWLVPAEALSHVENGFAGEAAERLARFETFWQETEKEQAKLAEELENLRAAGKKNSVQFKELLVKKLNGSNILLMLKMQGLE